MKNAPESGKLAVLARNLLALHHAPSLLVLPNIWNPIGARILADQGYPAVATASAAISASLGYGDGEKLRRSTLLDLIGRIASSVEVPVTADIESGYGETVEELAQTIRLVIEAGIVGVNLEDSVEDGQKLRPIETQCARIAAARSAAEETGVHLVINARTDCFLSSSYPDHDSAAADAITRANAYADAGADCVYPIGPGDEETARTLRDGITAPINLLVTPKAAPLAVLESAGINRVSFGPFLFRSCLRKFIEVSDSLKTQGDPSILADMLTKTETEAFLMDGFEAE